MAAVLEIVRKPFKGLWSRAGITDQTAQDIFTAGLLLRVILTIVGEIADASGE